MTSLGLLLPWLEAKFSQQDSLDRAIIRLAEPRTIDCGRVPRNNYAPAMTCAVAATKAGKPFKMILEGATTRRGVRTEKVSWGYVGSSNGDVVAMSYSWVTLFGLRDKDNLSVSRGNFKIDTKNYREGVWPSALPFKPLSTY